MIRQIPELADGGYWYVCEVITDEDGKRPDMPAADYCAQYGTTHAIVRVLTPIPITRQAIRPATVIGEAVASGALPAGVKPYMRLSGQ